MTQTNLLVLVVNWRGRALVGAPEGHVTDHVTDAAGISHAIGETEAATQKRCVLCVCLSLSDHCCIDLLTDWHTRTAAMNVWTASILPRNTSFTTSLYPSPSECVSVCAWVSRCYTFIHGVSSVILQALNVSRCYLSVCPLHGCMKQKRLKLWLWNFCHTVVPFQFYLVFVC